MIPQPLILALYEKYYLPLGMRLKPSLKGLIVALLPSLEEENNEYFNRVWLCLIIYTTVGCCVTASIDR